MRKQACQADKYLTFARLFAGLCALWRHAFFAKSLSAHTNPTPRDTNYYAATLLHKKRPHGGFCAERETHD